MGFNTSEVSLELLSERLPKWSINRKKLLSHSRC